VRRNKRKNLAVLKILAVIWVYQSLDLDVEIGYSRFGLALGALTYILIAEDPHWRIGLGWPRLKQSKRNPKEPHLV